MADQHDQEHPVVDELHSEIAHEAHESIGVADHTEHVGASGPMADPTFWATVAVLIFLGILVWKKIPSVLGKSLDDRAQKIQDELDSARILREKAQAALAEAERSQAQAEADAKEIINSAKREASAFAEQARTELKERMVRREKMAKERIARAEAEATQQVRTIAAEAAAKAAADIMKEKLSSSKDDNVFEASLEAIKKAL